MTDHEAPRNQENDLPPEGITPLEWAQIERDTTLGSRALQQASEDRRYDDGLEAEEDRRDRRGDSSFDNGYWRGPSNAPRRQPKEKKPARRRPVHTRHDGPTESDEFHNMGTGYLSRTEQELKGQRNINDRGKPIVLAALREALSPKTPSEPTPEEKAIALQKALEKRDAEVNASWDAIEAAINEKNIL